MSYLTRSLKWDNSQKPKVCFEEDTEKKCSDIGNLIGQHNSVYGCIRNDSWKCQPMHDSDGKPIEAISKYSEYDRGFDSDILDKFGSCANGGKDYDSIGDNNLNSVINSKFKITCGYPVTAIPTDEQAKKLYYDLENNDNNADLTNDQINYSNANNKELLLNYCLSKSENCGSNLKNCLKCLSLDGNAMTLCGNLKNKYPNEIKNCDTPTPTPTPPIPTPPTPTPPTPTPPTPTPNKICYPFCETNEICINGVCVKKKCDPKCTSTQICDIDTYTCKEVAKQENNDSVKFQLNILSILLIILFFIILGFLIYRYHVINI